VDHPTRALLAEVIVERPGGRQLRGSGYRVASEWVITADHVVAGAEKVGIWFGAPQELQDEAGVTVDPAKVLRAPWADLALLPIRSEHSQIDHPPLFGRLDRDVHEPVSARAAGFPWFKLRPAGRRSKVKLRELHEASGTIAAGSNAKTRTYELTQLNLVPREHPEPFKHSPWEGMSGAAVWAGSRLIGVIGQHHPGEGLATLTVRPIEELFGSDSLAQVSEWREALWRRLPPRAADLWLATPLDWRGHVLKHARDIAADLAPERLDDRESTLADLHGFSDSGRWRWVQGEAFAGKTALLAWFTLHARCSVVSCFLRRTTGDNTAGYALDTMSEQLAALSGGASYQPPAYLSGKRQEFSRLLADAARACDERGRRLLILLDGLDEYDSSSGLQLRDWLPHREESMPHNVALLVASRKEANIELPDDHPLRRHVKLLPP
jgi:Trypsin-like peptidase domain